MKNEEIMLAKKTIDEYKVLQGQYATNGFVVVMQVGIFYKIIGYKNNCEEITSKIRIKCLSDNNYKHCGFPTSALDKYLGRLILNGYSVVVFKYDEMEKGKRKLLIQVKNGGKNCSYNREILSVDGVDSSKVRKVSEGPTLFTSG